MNEIKTEGQTQSKDIKSSQIEDKDFDAFFEQYNIHLQLCVTRSQIIVTSVK